MRPPVRETVEADLTWTGEEFAAGLQVEVTAAGRIGRVGRLGAGPIRRLRRRALLPGFVNAHSHAFQRGLRGRGERFPEGAGSFWTWREAMYRLVEGLDEGAFLRLAAGAFSEMRAAGITSVGEFHYLRHSAAGRDYRFDGLVAEAAARAGVRLALLPAYYRSGGAGHPLEGGQLRFETAGPDEYWRQMDCLVSRLDPATQSLGAVVHSLRAASPDDLAAVGAEARRRGLVLHLHVEEQRREIEECVAAYGAPPMRLLLDRLDVGAWVTAVHCTHTAPGDLARYAATGGHLCLCPLTEGNLGDGLPGLSALSGAAPALCLGTDSNARISMLEEARWTEYGQRLATGSRGALRDARGGVASHMLRAATVGGASSLGLDCGEIAPGRWADFAAIDLDHPSLTGADADCLAEFLVFGAGEEVISATAVGGSWSEERRRR